MVSSLVDLSLRSIMDGIKNGTIQQPHLLYPSLRERVLDTAIKQDLANHPNGLELLSSVEFLNGMTSISAKASNDDDLVFLERLIESLATKLPNGETVGATIKTMNLKVYDYDACGTNFKNEETYSDTISKVHDLIAHCPNTASMGFQLSKSDEIPGYWPLNANENSAFNRVMEKLINLSIMCDGEHIFERGRPIINFKQLKTLKLESCYFYIGSWRKVLEKIPFVENLHLFNVNSYVNRLDWILPFPLPHLKSLEVIGIPIFECNKAFVDNMMECKQLRQVHLMLDQKSTDEESLIQLANMDIDLKMTVRIVVKRGDGAKIASILDSSSHFKLVRIFHEKMESFELFFGSEWDSRISTALEDVVNTCSNLTSFGIRQPQIEYKEKERFNATLIRFFGNPQRALQLQGLRLLGDLDEIVLSTVFENCPNLVLLDIRQCPNLRDHHLIDWVACGGGKLIDLFVKKCYITSECIIPILAKSGEGLLGYYCSDVGQDNGGRNWEMVLRNRCPNAQ